MGCQMQARRVAGCQSWWEAVKAAATSKAVATKQQQYSSSTAAVQRQQLQPAAGRTTSWTRPTIVSAHLQTAAVGGRGRQPRLDLAQLRRQALHHVLGRGAAVAHRLRKTALQRVDLRGSGSGCGRRNSSLAVNHDVRKLCALPFAAQLAQPQAAAALQHTGIACCIAYTTTPATPGRPRSRALTYRSTRSSWWHSCTWRRRTASSWSRSTVSWRLASWAAIWASASSRSLCSLMAASCAAFLRGAGDQCGARRGRCRASGTEQS